MGLIFPTMQTLFASSSADLATMFNFLFPLIPFALACVVAVAGVQFMLGVFYFIEDKIAGVDINFNMSGEAHNRASARSKIMNQLQIDEDWKLWKRSKGL